MAKAKPGEVNYASAGNGTGQHLSAELFKLMAGVDMTHVPYRGATPAYSDVISGRTPVFFDNLASALGQIKGGAVRALGVTGKERSPSLPDVPPFAKAANATDFEAVSWHMLFAPAATPKAIVEKLNAEMSKIMSDTEMQKKVTDIGLLPIDPPSLADTDKYLVSERAKWGDLVKKLGLEGSQ